MSNEQDVREVYESFRVALETRLQAWAQAAPNQPAIAVASIRPPSTDEFGGTKRHPSTALSPLELAEQVRMRTPFGERFAQRWYKLATERALGELLRAELEE